MVSKGSLVVAKGVKVNTLYLCTCHHTISSTLIISEKNECSGTIAAIEQGKQAVVVVFETML